MMVDQNQEHLRLLSLFHYVTAGLSAFFALFPLLYVFIGMLMLAHPGSFQGQQMPDGDVRVMAGVFIGIGLVFSVFGFVFTAAQFLAGRFLKRRRFRVFCMIVAVAECLLIPFGTLLGVCTIIVLVRYEVKQEFDGPPPLPV